MTNLIEWNLLLTVIIKNERFAQFFKFLSSEIYKYGSVIRNKQY